MTISTEKLTIEQLRAIIAVYEKPFAMIGPIDYGYLAAKELLAVKLEQSAPVLYASPETLAYAKAGELFFNYAISAERRCKYCAVHRPACASATGRAPSCWW